jgi:glycosyltransferase involved in cell wall biosynthesis
MLAEGVEPRPHPRARGAETPVRVGIVCDYEEEEWPSMELAAELLALGLDRYAARELECERLQPAMPRIARRLDSRARLARNADRYVGRYVFYPRWLKPHRWRFHLFHVVDHSYAHLVHVLPPERTVVTCHDLDAFRSILEPGAEPRPAWFRRTMRRVWRGLGRAAHVVCDSEAVRHRLLETGILPPWRVSVVPLPVHPDFTPDADPAADAEAALLLGPAAGAPPDLLHVGSTAPRKRISFLLRVYAGVRERHPAVRLLRVGGPLAPRHRALAEELGVADGVVELPFLPRPVLAAVYRRAALVLLPSAREGFGFPVVEAMACGTPVVASRLRVLREAGGEAAVYRRPDDLEGWVAAVDEALWDRRHPREWRGRREAALERADAFSLEGYTRRIMDVYRPLLERSRP